MTRSPPSSTLFPYTTLFRSRRNSCRSAVIRLRKEYGATGRPPLQQIQALALGSSRSSRRKRGCGRVRRPRLQKPYRAQIFARFVEATAAEGSDEFPPILQPFDVDFPFAPREKFVGKGKRIRIFIFQHERGLPRVPFVFGRQYGCAEHIEKSVHLRFHFIAKHAERMM